MGFPKDVRIKALVASARYCCSCHKNAKRNIEVHHIIPKAEKGEDTFENAIPLCLDCHADAGHYNPKHPKGTKYSPEELRLSRDEWYSIVKDGKVPLFDIESLFSSKLIAFQNIEKIKSKSYKELYENHLIALTHHEELECVRIFQEIILNRYALIKGEPAIGKTVYAIQIAELFKKLKFACLYHSFRFFDFNEDEIFEQINELKHGNVLIILDDCHLNYETVSKITYYYLNNDDSICFLFISRNTSPRLQNSEVFDSNFINEFEDNIFNVEVIKPKKKVELIIKGYKNYYVSKYSRPFYVGSNTKIAKHVGNNLIALKAYLNLWKNEDTLSKIGKDKMLKVFYQKAYGKLEKAETECLNIYLSMYHFELSFEKIPFFDKETEKFEREGVILRNYNSYYFEHTKTTNLYLDSYYKFSENRVNTLYNSQEEFICDNIIKYVQYFETLKYPENLHNIITTICNTRVIELKTFLENKNVENIALNFYSDESKIDEALGFLNKVSLRLSNKFQEYFELIVLNSAYSYKYLEHNMFALYYANILKNLNRFNNNYFSELFEFEEVISFFKDSKLVSLKQGLLILSNHVDKTLADNILESISNEEIIDKIYKSQFSQISHAFKVFEQICPERLEKEIIPEVLNDEIFYETFNKKDVGFVSLGEFVQVLEAINSDYVVWFFERYKINSSKLSNSISEKSGIRLLLYLPIFLKYCYQDTISLIEKLDFEFINKLYDKLLTKKPESFLFKFSMFIILHFKKMKQVVQAAAILRANLKQVRSKLDFVQYIFFIEILSNYYDTKPIIMETDKNGERVLYKKLGNLKETNLLKESIEKLEKLLTGQGEDCYFWLKKHRKDITL